MTLITRPNWDGWQLETNYLTLRHDTHPDYSIDLATIKTCPAMLSWIFHVNAKTYLQSHTGGLINAINDILEPMRNYCPFEKNMTANGAQLTRQFIKENIVPIGTGPDDDRVWDYNGPDGIPGTDGADRIDGEDDQ